MIKTHTEANMTAPYSNAYMHQGVFRVHHSNLLWSADTKTFTGDASELRLAPGMVPKVIDVKGRFASVFYRLYEVLAGNEGWVYLADTNLPGATGTKLVVWND